MPDIDNLTLETEEITIRGKTFKIIKPAKLEEIFQGDPFLNVDKFPFWFKVWEASIVLADYIATLEPPKEILEIEAGLGVPSIVAAGFGHKVLATEYDELPLKLIERAAKENNLKIETQILDWRNLNFYEKFDLIIGAEIILKKSLFDPLINFFKSFLKDQGEVILAHSSERKRVLIPFLYYAQQDFDILTSIRKIRGEEGTTEIILNKLIFKKN
jgi:predicted nicotinamide N-methyase